jgi:hypothetical protein
MAWAWSALFHLEDMNVYVHLAWGYLFSFFPGRLVSFGFGCSSAGRMRGSEFVPYGVWHWGVFSQICLWLVLVCVWCAHGLLGASAGVWVY